LLQVKQKVASVGVLEMIRTQQPCSPALVLVFETILKIEDYDEKEDEEETGQPTFPNMAQPGTPAN